MDKISSLDLEMLENFQWSILYDFGFKASFYSGEAGTELR